MKKLSTVILGAALAFGTLVPAMAASSPHHFRSTDITVATANGTKTISCENFAYQGTTWVPIYYLLEVLRDGGASANWNGKTQTIKLSDPFVTPKLMPAQSGSVNFVLNGTSSPFHASRIVARDPQSGVETTYLKLGDLQSVLGMAYSINAPWNGSVSPNTWTLPKLFDPVPHSSQIIGNTGNAVFYLVGGYGGTYQGMTLMGTPFFANSYYLISVSGGSVQDYLKFSSQPSVQNDGQNILVYGKRNIAVVSTGGVGDNIVKIPLPLPNETIQNVEYISPGTNPNLVTNDPAIQVSANDGNTYYFDVNTGNMLTPTLSGS